MVDSKGRKSPHEWMESGWGFIVLSGIAAVAVAGAVIAIVSELFA